MPLVSTLNSDGRVKANAAIVGAGTNGGINVFATDPTHVVLDINGYFVPPAGSGLQFYPLTPCRIANTRNSSGPLGGSLLGAETARDFPILTSACGVPSTAQAYSLNFTAVPAGSIGFLTAWPAGSSRPLASTLNAPQQAVTANSSIVLAGTSGDISVYSSDETDLVIDINGYFAPAGSGGLSFYALTPCRALDTRNVGSSQPFTGLLDTNVVASECGVPASAQAVVASQGTQLILDIFGYFAPPSSTPR